MLFKITFSLDSFSFGLCCGVALQLCDHLSLLMERSLGYLPSVSFRGHDLSPHSVHMVTGEAPCLCTEILFPWSQLMVWAPDPGWGKKDALVSELESAEPFMMFLSRGLYL